MRVCGYAVMTSDEVHRAARLNLIDVAPAQEFDEPHWRAKFEGLYVIEIGTIGL